MSNRESRLFLVFGILLLGAGLLFGGRAGFTKWQGAREETTRLRQEVTDMQALLDDRRTWERRHEWIESALPRHASRQEASASLLALVEAAAHGAGVKLAKRELIAPSGNTGEDEAGDEAYFDRATVQVGLEAPEKDVVAWLHRVQNPPHFCGVTRLVLEPGGEAGGLLRCEAEITLWYREEAVPTETPVPGKIGSEFTQEGEK